MRMRRPRGCRAVRIGRIRNRSFGERRWPYRVGHTRSESTFLDTSGKDHSDPNWQFWRVRHRFRDLRGGLAGPALEAHRLPLLHAAIQRLADVGSAAARLIAMASATAQLA